MVCNSLQEMFKGADKMTNKKERRVKCKYCNKPIKVEDFGGVDKKECFTKIVI